LGVHEIGIDDDFVALGGDSLSSLRVLLALEALLGLDVVGHAAAGSLTIASMAEHLVELGCDRDGDWEVMKSV
jgi:acyl carrier protein